MDFGVVGLEGGGGLVCSDTAGLAISSLSSSNAAAEDKYRSGFHKQERSGTYSAEDEWREFKVGKTCDDFSASKAMLLLHHQQQQQQQKSCLLRSNSHHHSLLSEGQQQQQMLSFSSPNSQNVSLPYYTSSTAYSRNAGYGSGGLNGGSMHGVFNAFRGPFAPSQWMELELQALIYKYITSNVPIPSYLLNPIRKALDSAGFSSFPGLRPNNSVGWGAFHLGFSNNTDPEPGRCRRTDGKKWRCSRDAVADQKYCERHMNRGRHRSRKPVEGQPGHSVSGTTSSTSKLPVASSTPSAAVPGSGASNSLSLAHHQVNGLQAGGTNPSSASHQFDRNYLDKANTGDRYQATTNLSIPSPTVSLKDQYSIPKPQNSREESARTEFGIVCSDSLLNPLNKSSSLISCRNYGTTEDLNDHDSKSQHPLRQFMDDWPRNRSESSAISWSNIDVHSDGTQLSISIPMATSDYVSATSSPNNQKLATSPLRLLPELEATQMGLGVGTVVNEHNSRQGTWIPISWQSSMDGPLGEVLHSTNNGTGDWKNTSALNLMTDGWDSSPRMVSSPTGVLQKPAIGSHSNSSAGSSPTPENNKTPEGATLYNGLFRSTLPNPTLPEL